MTLQQIVLSKNALVSSSGLLGVLTLQQIVLSKNEYPGWNHSDGVLTLQQIVLSKNFGSALSADTICFDFTTNCSF